MMEVFEPEWELEHAAEPMVAELDSPFAEFSGTDLAGEWEDIPSEHEFEEATYEGEAEYDELPGFETSFVDDFVEEDGTLDEDGVEPEYYPEQEYFTDFEAPAKATLAARIAAVAVAERDRWGSKVETNADMIPVLREYWKTGGGMTVSDRPEWHAKNPWSAVFIGWVMRKAGARTFPKATAHRQYVSSIKRRTEGGDTSSEFWAYPIHRAAPAVGDLVCADRPVSGSRCNGATYENIDNGTQWATHCDVVVGVDRAKRLVRVIGGNVGDSVKQKTYKLDAQGFLLPKQGCGHFAVIKIRDAAAVATAALSGDALAKALRLNRSYGQSLGWRDQADDIARLVGAPGVHTDETRFAQAVAAWQPRQGFTPDGIVGPTTWAQLRRLMGSQQEAPTQSGVPPLGGPKQPKGFRLGGKGRGLVRASGERLDTVLRRLRQRGLVTLTDQTMDTFQRIANVETGGKIQALNTWDSAVVSSGFLQLTLEHGKMQEWIRKAPSAFQRYGIAVDDSRGYRFPGQDKPQPAIVGVQNRDELRWNGWAERFYQSGLDDEVIAAECVLAEQWLKRHLTGLRARLRAKGQLPAMDYFQPHYNRSAYLRGMFQAAYNNLPVAATNATIIAVREAKKSADMTTDRFVGIYANAVITAYAARKDTGVRVVKETRSGLSKP